MSKINVMIGTTAINRPELHTDVMPDWINWILDLDKENYNIVWFINIDVIEKLDSSYEETKNSFVNMIEGRIQTAYLRASKGNGNFFVACKCIGSHIEAYVQRSKSEKEPIILWLEDDWTLLPSSIMNINVLLTQYLSDMCHINLTFIRNNYIHALAPSILSYKLWKNLHYQAWINQESYLDPEHVVGKRSSRLCGKQDNINNLTIINRKIEPSYLAKRSFLNEANSFYTYAKKEYNSHVDQRWVDVKDIKTRFDSVPLFIRITPSACSDGGKTGRVFMESRGLYKRKKWDTIGTTDFYKVQ